jgi:putative aldouronate transport system permease protein
VLSKTRIRASTGNTIFNIVNYTVFSLFTLLCIYPFYYLIINTISANDLSSNGLVNFLPQKIHFKNYIEVLKIKGLANALMISILRTAAGTALTVLASAFLGFMFTQQKMWKRKLWYRFLIITMYFNAGLIPVFIIMYILGLTNNFLVYIIPAIVQPFYIILVKTYFESVPDSLQQAAEIDGAGIIRIFLQIMLPLSLPIIATVAIFSAVGQWNSFYDTLIYVTDQKLYSLQYLLYTYINQSNSLAMLIRTSTTLSGDAMAALATKQTPTSVRMTVSVIVVAPIILVYPMFQRYFIKGIMIGSIKG